MKKIILSISFLTLCACSVSNTKTTTAKAKDDFVSCVKEQALVMMMNPTTSSLSTQIMAKQITQTCNAKTSDALTKSDSEINQLVSNAISAAKNSRNINSIQ